jgi:putative ABC transport system permease protein
MGAGTGRIMLILNKEFIRMITIALVIALPLAGYFATQWLDNFAYRIRIDWSIYGWTILIGLVSAGIAVSYHTIKAATADPAESLRTE